MRNITESEALAFLMSFMGRKLPGEENINTDSAPKKSVHKPYYVMNRQALHGLKKHFGDYVTAALAFEHEYMDILSPDLIKAIITRRESSGIRSVIDEYSKMGVHFVSLYDSSYPHRLRDIPDAPEALFFYGRLPDDSLPSVAVIGARNCSGYGRQMAREFARELAENGIQVISGMARGIDGLAEDAAMSAGGYACSVLGCGIDTCYPRENKGLYDRCMASGCILSEYAPGTPPNPRFFPARNRIISGLSDSVIVIEAREHSGTLITVNMALEQGRDIYALPGRINDSLSYGCNLLIRDGATPLLRPHEFVAEFYSRLGISPLSSNGICKADTEPSCGQAGKSNIFLTDIERVVISVLDYRPKSINEIYMDIPDNYIIELTQLMQTLTGLTIRHLIKCIDGSNYYLEKM